LPAATRALSNWTSTASRGSAVGITQAAGRLGAGAAAAIVAFLIAWLSWPLSFVVLGILSAFWAALWWWSFHEDPRRHPDITATEMAAFAVAGILSPLMFGWILDRTGSWTTPFSISLGLLLFGSVMTYWFRPDRPIDAVPSVGSWATLGE
jgi:sugar phosphate permease